MAKDAKLSGAGLRGQVAGQTSLCTVGTQGSGLNYRGYDVDDLADNCIFEEVAHLILKGHLPTQAELDSYLTKLAGLRDLPDALKSGLELIPPEAHPMDVMRTGVSLLGNLEQETDFADQSDKVDRIMALLPAIVVYWYRFSHDGVRVGTDTQAATIGGHFLHMLHDKAPSVLHERVMNVSLILYAEHEFNASTFNGRVAASTLTDIFSVITGAIGTLRGPLHGGANEAAMEMIEQWQTPDEAEEAILQKLATKELIMGFGHAVYKERDPRNAIIKKWSEQLAEEVNDQVLYPVSVRVEEVMKREEGMFCNADFFHASAYNFMGIPTGLFTPIFVMSRITGWAAHAFEQRANNRIIRPSAEYTGPEHRKVEPIAERG